MQRTRRIVFFTTTILLLTILAADCVASRQAGEKSAEQAYKNIRVLGEMPASKLLGAMNYMSAALGVNCNHCHTDEWESDVKPAKEATRKMIVMTRDLNKQSFSGYDVVSCYTCHRGTPNTVAAIPQYEAELWSDARAMAPPSLADRPGSSGLPTVDRIVSDYVTAIGGEAAINKLSSLVSKGSMTTIAGGGPPSNSTIEVRRQSPDKLLIVAGAGARGYDGKNGWTTDGVKAGVGAREIEGDELAEIRREAEFYRLLKLKESYPRMGLLGKEKVGGRDAFVIGASGHDGSREKLYFDVERSLLIRRYSIYRTVMGAIPELIDFDDYRDVGGVKLPFVVRWTRPPFSSTRRFTEIRINIPLESSGFARP